MLAWVQLYSYTFTNMATAVVYRSGGFKFVERVRSEPHAILFLVRPMPRTQDSDGNPASSFYLSAVQLVYPGEGTIGLDKSLKESCDFWLANWSQAREAALRRRIYHDDSVECGALPALYILQDSVVMPISTVLIRRLSPDRDNLSDESLLFVFEDIVNHCLDIMHAGFILQHSSGPGRRPLPDVGYMVQRKKREWRWKLLFGWFWDQSDRTLPLKNPRKTGLNADKLWERFFYG